MKIVTAPIVKKYFAEKIGKTAIECAVNGQTITAFVNGNKEQEPSILASLRINEVGDTFVAQKDSAKMDDSGKPYYLKGETVTRQSQSVDFLSFAGNNSATQFAQGASAFGLQLNVIMQG